MPATAASVRLVIIDARERLNMTLRKALRVGGVSAAAVAVAAGAVVLVGPAQADAGRYEATITRTEYGIPHVRAENLPSAGFGYGYAFAQDNLCTLADTVLTLAGERSRYFGPNGEADNGASESSNLDSDVYYRGVNESGKISELLESAGRLAPSAEAKSMVAGYVAGVNRYLEDTGVGGLPDPRCRGKEWVRPITDLDVWRIIHDFNQVGGASAFLPQIATATPQEGTGDAGQPSTVPRSEIGSNGWAIGSEATRSGNGMLLGTPHFPWHGGKRFYQVQLTVPGELNVSGISAYGSPFVSLGHNASLAWTHTVSTAQRFTMFQLQLTEGDPTSYVVDGKPEQMSTVDIPVEVLGDNGELSTVHRTLYTSRYGPLLSDGWSNTTAFALRDANTDNLRDADEWLGYGRARDVGELEKAQRAHQSMPFLNTLASDQEGNAYYADAGVVPHVTDEHAKKCVDTPEGQEMYPRTTVLNGARSECGWGRDDAAIEPGLFGPDTMPKQIRDDYVGNSNDSPWLTNVLEPLTGYPRIFGDIADQRSPRDRSAHTMMADRRSGDDGLGEPGFDLESLRATMFGNRVYSAELLGAGVVEMCQQNPTLTTSDGASVDVSQACQILANWDTRADIDSRGAVLWHEFYEKAQEADDLYLVPFDPANPVATPNTLNQGSAVMSTALADTVARFAELGVAPDVPLGDVQRATFGAERIPVHGCVSSDGCFNVIRSSERTLGEDGYGDVTFGTSFVLAVELTEDGPKSSTITTYSQSANPESPHFTDQTRLYEQKKWVTGRFTDAEIAADPNATTTTVRG